MKPEKITKQNKILLLTKQNETKFRWFFSFAKQAKFRETIVLFRYVSLCFAMFRVSRNKKKDAKWKPYSGQQTTGSTRGSPPFYLTNLGHEPQVKPGDWRPVMWALENWVSTMDVVFIIDQG
jgi:hypothetical protein